MNWISWGINPYLTDHTAAATASAFVTVGAAAHYLAPDSPYRNAGTTGVSEDMAARLKQTTTYPPIVYSNVTLGTSLTLGPQAQRDTDRPDLGYHYEPLDYVFGQSTLSNATLTLLPGAAVGTFDQPRGHGLRLLAGASLISEGEVDRPIHITRYNTVQEQATTNWSGIAYHGYLNATGGGGAQARFRFTEWSGRDRNFCFGNDASAVFDFTGCQFWPGRITNHAPVWNFTNCLFFRTPVGVEGYQYDLGIDFTLNNCLLVYGGVGLSACGEESSATWTARNNLFYQTVIDFPECNGEGGMVTAQFDYNAYLDGFDRLNEGPHDVVLASLAFESGPLGDFYLTNNCPLINAGRTNAHLLALYHYTTTADQVKETNSVVDIGFHYVAVNGSGQPLDTDGDGVPDYLEDANGRLTSRWTPEKGMTLYGYDAVGNLLSITYPLSPAINLSYDRLNRLTNMVDAVGTTRYRYTNHVLLSEDGPWASDTVTYSYQQSRQRSGLTLAQPNASPWVQTYAHDAIKRLTNVTSPAGAFSYKYPNPQPSTLISQLSLPGGSYITNAYDANARLLSTKLLNSQHSTLNSHSYRLNAGNQRTAVTNFHGNTWDYSYDGLGQLVAARGKEPGGTTNRLHEQYGYKYDPAGNLNARTNNALVQSFLVNSLNQLTTNTRTGTLTVAGTTTSAATNVTVNGAAATLYADATFARQGVAITNGWNSFTAVAQDALGRRDTNTVSVHLPATNHFAYDLNGNLIRMGGAAATPTLFLDYDDENQLIRVTATNQWKSEFSYDGKMRLRVRKEYVWQSGIWNLQSEIRYLYDGMLPIQFRDGNNLPTLTFTRGRDLSGTLEGAGGIGGLLALTENSTLNSGSSQPASAFYHADGNGNVTALVNTNQFIVARYAYDPYGNTLALSGAKALVNPYCFSSKEHHERSGFYYYTFRWYIPELQRWVNRDPVGERDDTHLYRFVRNDPPNKRDPLGLFTTPGDVKWCCLHPTCCSAAMGLPSLVEKKMEKEYPGTGNSDGTMENAIKHCTWMCATASLKPCGPELAQALGDTHEEYPGNDPDSKAMDLWNNQVGISLAEPYNGDPNQLGNYKKGIVNKCFNKCKANVNNLVWIK